jgi:hypothetical protein
VAIITRLFALLLILPQTGYSMALPHLPATQYHTHVNNKGDLGRTLEALGKEDSIKALALAMVTAGVLQGLDAKLNLANINAQAGFGAQLTKNIINNTASATIDVAINGGNFEDKLNAALKNAFIDTGAAQGANLIGNIKVDGKLNDYTHQLAHAIAGCAAGMAKNGDCGSSALGAVVGEIAAEAYGGSRLNGTNLDIASLQTDTVNFARMMAAIAAAVTGNDVNAAAAAGGNAAENNYLNHLQINDKQSELAAAKTQADKDAVIAKYDKIDKEQNATATTCVHNGNCPSVMEAGEIKQALADLQAGCAPPRDCSPDAIKSINELNGIYNSADGITPVHPLEEATLYAMGGNLIGRGVGAGLEWAFGGTGKVVEVAAGEGFDVINWGTGSIRPPAFSPRNPGEAILIDDSQGLQSRSSGLFYKDIFGELGQSETKHLWTIDERGINVALEQSTATGNTLLKHTNLSSEASIGGEVWFGENNTVTINPFSGRFGTGQVGGVTDTQWTNTIKAWESLGYKVKTVPLK